MPASTKHWRPIVNGYSGFQPPSFFRHADVLQAFPSDAAIGLLRSLAVTHVFVHTSQVPADTFAAIRARTDLQLVDTFGSIVLFRLEH